MLRQDELSIDYSYPSVVVQYMLFIYTVYIQTYNNNTQVMFIHTCVKNVQVCTKHTYIYIYIYKYTVYRHMSTHAHAHRCDKAAGPLADVQLTHNK